MKKIKTNNLEMHLRENTSDYKAIQEVLIKGAYERQYFQIEAGERWLDLGANVGAFSCLVLSRGATVIPVEPEPENAQLAQLNINRNGFDARVRCVAVTHDRDTRSKATFYLSNTDYAQWRHSLSNIGGKRRKAIEVSLVPFSQLLDGVDGVKLDVEGAEIEILENVQSFQNVRKLCFEYHFDVDSLVARYNAINNRLGDFFDEIRAPKRKIEHFTAFPQAERVFAWKTS